MKIRIFERLVIWIFGPSCEKCGGRDLVHSHAWIRGYNHLCRQADGDCGVRCADCGHIKWEKSLEEYKATLPEWCTAYESR